MFSQNTNTQATSAVAPVSIVVVDDYPVVRHGLCELIAMQQGLQLVGDAADSQSGLNMIRLKRPDILLLDLELGKSHSCSEYLAEVRRISPHTRIVIYTGHDKEELVLETIRCGASAYVLKGSNMQWLFDAIHIVIQGGSYLDPHFTSLVFDKLGLHQEPRITNRQVLSKRELEVLVELVSGKRNREIAESLYISERTVKFHIKSMFGKFRAKTRTEVVKIALQKGIV